MINFRFVFQGRHAVELGALPGQEKAMRVKGLECLGLILKCMVEWSRELYINPASQSNLAGEGIAESEGGMGKSGANGGGSGSASTSNIPASGSAYQFEEIKQQKEILEQGIDLFDRKPKQGIKYLQDRGLIGPTATDIANFFHSEDRLNKVREVFCWIS